MSHEIRTPLNAIVGFSRIIAESTDEEERLGYYEIVESNNERLLQLINEILDLSKIESGIVEFTITPVRLHPLCKEIHDAHIFRCPEGVELIYEPSDENIVIDGDKNRIFQVISNLIGNAFKFTTSGHISYGYRREGKYVAFHVTDTGMGIAPDKVDRVFERFVKVNNFAQGTGLGLSICKTIIERLGGNISVTSEVGKGTTFTFVLPLESTSKTEAEKKEEDNQETTAETHSTEQRGKNAAPGDSPKNEEVGALPTPPFKTILIAEDTESNFILINAILGRLYPDLFKPHFIREVTREDILKLMEIKMGRILKFNTDKCNATIAQYKEDIAKIDDHLAHIVDYTADWFMMLKEKYGKNYPRMTEVRNFDTIEATKVVEANEKLYINRAEGFIGKV